MGKHHSATSTFVLRSIFVHNHSVFCVPCTVCDNVQQCAAMVKFS
jgi:hypothetical protein